MTEIGTCRKLVTSKLVYDGWNSVPLVIGKQDPFTTGSIIFSGDRVRRGGTSMSPLLAERMSFKKLACRFPEEFAPHHYWDSHWRGHKVYQILKGAIHTFRLRTWRRSWDKLDGKLDSPA